MRRNKFLLMKIILLFMLIVVFSQTIFGQENKLALGIEGGLNASYFSVKEKNYLDGSMEDISQIASFSVGTTIQHKPLRRFSLRYGVTFERKGFYYNTTVPDIYNATRKTVYEYFDYLMVPLLFQITIGKKINYFINAGFYTAFLTNRTLCKTSISC